MLSMDTVPRAVSRFGLSYSYAELMLQDGMDLLSRFSYGEGNICISFELQRIIDLAKQTP